MASLEVPTWVIYAGTALGVAFCYIAVWFGKQSGRMPKPEVEIAGALVDSSAIKELTAELRALHGEMAEGRETKRDMGHHVGRKLDGLSEQMKALSSEVQQLRIEVAIRRKQ